MIDLFNCRCSGTQVKIQLGTMKPHLNHPPH